MLASGAKIVIRADASSQIGAGHIMRCLTLADGLRAIGCSVTFVCRRHEGHLQALIESKLYRCCVLECKPTSGIEVPVFLGATQEQDALEFIAVLDGISERPAWVICDHYALDRVWHDRVRRHADRLMVIDDLADRRYNCDVLLDPSYLRQAETYQDRVPEECRLLMGSKFALLRDEFSVARLEAEAREYPPITPPKILITMGGADPKNLTSKALEALALVENFESIVVDVVMGASAVHLESVCGTASRSPFPVQIHTNTSAMAQLMLDADLAIGASGGTSWERCCIGLPSLLIILAENQREIARTLDYAGAAVDLGEASILEVESIAEAIEFLLGSPRDRHAMSQKARAICDGRGKLRTVLAMADPMAADGTSIMLEAVSLNDARLLFRWQCHPETRRYARSKVIPVWNQHLEWLKGKLERPDCSIYKVMHGREPAGVIRLDPLDDQGAAEVSIYVAPDKYRLGIGLIGLRLLKLHHPGVNIHAHVLSENIASQRIFEAAGYSRVDDNNFVSRVNN